MLNIAMMISNGADTNKYRDIAKRAALSVAHMFTYELERLVAFSEWDYRMDVPRVVPSGTTAARSLSMVERSECILAIFGPSVPTLTSAEITKVFERREVGEQVDFWLFLNPDQAKASHDAFLEGIKLRFGEEILWSPYRDELEFQSLAMTTLFSYVSRKLLFNPVVGVRSAES